MVRRFLTMLDYLLFSAFSSQLMPPDWKMF